MPTASDANQKVSRVPGVDRIHVLLVDDDDGDRALARLALEKSSDGRFCVVFTDGLTPAIEHLRSGRFDVMLPDLGLPESCGLETLAKVRQVNNDVPIVVLTDLIDDQSSASGVGQRS